LPNVKGIENLTSLTWLYIENSNLNSVKEIEGLTQMQHLNISHNNLTSLKGIEKLTRLRQLDATHNRLTNLKGLEKSYKLEDLWVGNNQLTSIKATKSLKLVPLEDHGDPADAGMVDFRKNYITKKHFKKNLSTFCLEEYDWLKYQINSQYVIQYLDIRKPKKITKATSKIIGKTKARAKVKLLSDKGKTIRTATANPKGIFTLKKLRLKKYGGKYLRLKATREKYVSKSKKIKVHKR